MAISEGDILLFKDNQTYLGKTVLNLYTYRVDLIDPSLEDDYEYMGATFWNNIQTEIISLQYTTLTHTQVDVENLTNGLDFGTFVTGDTGGAGTGQGDASLKAYGLVFNRSTKLVKSGGKRIAGVSEALVADNSVISAGLTMLNDLALKLKVCIVVESGGVDILKLCPVIVGRDASGAYDLARVDDVANVTVNPYVTTQNSRKQKRT